MRKETHRRIAKAIARRLNLSRDQKITFVRIVSNFDSIERKRNRKRCRRKRHHTYYNTYSIYYRVDDYVRQARNYYLNGHIEEALWYLGAALHLAQDALIPSPRSWGSLHDYIERELARLTVPEGVIEESLGENESPFSEYIEAIEMLRGYISESIDNPVEIMNAATCISAKLAYAVLGPPTPPPDILAGLRRLEESVEKRLRKLKEAREAHKPYVRKACKVLITGFILSLSVFVMSTTIIPVSSLLASLSLAAIFPIMSAIRAHRILRADERYCDAKKKYQAALRNLLEYIETKGINKWYMVDR